MKSILTAALLLSASLLHADVPSLINYQGLLTDINGNVVSGSKTVSISIHDAATDGTQLYSESLGSVTVQNGIYSFQFGSGPTFTTTLATGSQLWLQVTLDGVPQTPRERLVSVPFAMKAVEADIAGFNAAAEARVRQLEDSYLIDRIDNYSYNNRSSPTIPANLVWESFNVEAGKNGLVSGSTVGSYANQRFNAHSFAVQDLSSTNAQAGIDSLVTLTYKVINVGALTHRAEAEFTSPHSQRTAWFNFNYADSTSASVSVFIDQPNQYILKSVENPNPAKVVQSVVIQMQNNKSTAAIVRNAKIATRSAASVTLNIPAQAANWSSFRTALFSGTQTGDQITYTITNGSTTMSSLQPHEIYEWTGSSAPSSLTLTMQPGPGGSALGTSVSTLGLTFN